jgi:hypothetical protein
VPKPIGSMATINYKQGEKKRKEREDKEREEENCADNQKSALNCGYSCHQHAKVAKMEHEESKRQKKKKETVQKMIDGPDHCIHAMKILVCSSRLSCVCGRTAKFTSTRRTRTRILRRTSAVGANVRTSTQRSSYGKA